MSEIRLFLLVSIALLIASMAFSGCIHGSGQAPSGNRWVDGLYVYEVMVMPDTPVTNLTLMVPLPYLDGVSTVADAVERGEGMNVPPGWSIMIIDGDDAVFLKIEAAEAVKCDSSIFSGEVPDECTRVSPGCEVATDPACRFKVVVPAHISVPEGPTAINNPLLSPKMEIMMQKSDEDDSGRPVPAPRLPAISYSSLVYARYDASESSRLYGSVIVTGVIPEGIRLSGDTAPGNYKTVYVDEIRLDRTGSQAGWHRVNGTVTYCV